MIATNRDQVKYLLNLEETSSVLYKFSDTKKKYEHLSTSVGVFNKDIEFDASIQAHRMNLPKYKSLSKCPHGGCLTCECQRYSGGTK
jgi:hypothetical protein